jgi:hypothetical protein
MDKDGGPKGRLWIHRILGKVKLANEIRNFTIHIREHKIVFERLLLTADETTINSADAVIGPLRYLSAGAVTASVISNKKDII